MREFKDWIRCSEFSKVRGVLGPAGSALKSLRWIEDTRPVASSLGPTKPNSRRSASTPLAAAALPPYFIEGSSIRATRLSVFLITARSSFTPFSAARRSFNKNWEQSDLIGNVVNVKRNVEDEFKLDYAKILGKLDRDSVKKIKAKIGLGDKNPEAWASIRQAPLLEALAAGTGERQTAAVGNVTTFNDTAFFKVLDRYSIEVKEELWGKEVVDQLDRARSAWLMRNRKIESTSSSNPSGTAAATELMRSGRFMASGPSRNIGMALNSIFGDRAQKYSINKAAERATREAVDENILPTEIIDNTRIASLMELESNYLGTHGAKYMQALQSATRIFGLNMAVDAKTKK